MQKIIIIKISQSDEDSSNKKRFKMIFYAESGVTDFSAVKNVITEHEL